MDYFKFVSSDTPVGYTKAQRAVSAALYSITIPVALTGNLLLIFIVTRRPKTRTLTGFLFVNMAAADLLVTLVDMPSAMAVPYTSIQWPPGIMGDITCKAVYFGFFVAITASILSLTLMSVDRFLGVVYPLRRFPRFRNARLLSFILWLSSMIFMIPVAILWKVTDQFKPGKFQCFASFGDLLGDYKNDITFLYTYLFFLKYLIPLCLITVLYGLVSRKLWRHKVPGDRLVSRDFDSKRRQGTKKIVRTLVVVTAAFAICWLPAQSYYLTLAFNFELHDRLPRFVMFVCNWCGHSNSAVNPWLYMLLSKKFRRVLNDMMYKLYLKIYLTLSHPDPNRETCV